MANKKRVGPKSKTEKASSDAENVETVDLDNVEEIEDAESEEDGGEPAATSSKPGPASKKKAAAKKPKTPTKRAAPASSSPGTKGKRQKKAVELFQAPILEPKKRQGGGGGSKKKEEYEVEAIHGIKLDTNDKWQFQIKWKGYAENQKTWEPKANVGNCKQHIKTFLEKAKRLAD